MAIMACAKNGNFDPISEGVHLATCIWVIDLGNQWSDMFGKASRKVMLTWEIPDELITVDGEEKPRIISKEYTLSLNEKAKLREHLEAWRGRKFSEQELQGFDLANILTKSCQLQILHNEKGYPNVASVMALPKGMQAPGCYHETIYFDLTDNGCLEMMEKLPAWIQDKVKQSEEYKGLINATLDHSPDEGEFVPVADDDELPFK